MTYKDNVRHDLTSRSRWCYDYFERDGQVWAWCRLSHVLHRPGKYVVDFEIGKDGGGKMGFRQELRATALMVNLKADFLRDLQNAGYTLVRSDRGDYYTRPREGD